MNKTKLGIPEGLMALIICLLCYYGGYVVTALVVGYVIFKEESEFLKKLALKVLVLLLAFSLLNTLVNLIPDVINLTYSVIHIFAPEFYLHFIDRIFNFIYSIVYFVKTLVFLALAFYSLQGKEFTVPYLEEYLDKLIKKYLAE